MVGDPLPVDAYGAFGHLGSQAEAVESPYRIAGQVDPGALGSGVRATFDDLDLCTPIVQGAGRGQAGNSGADDQDAHTVAAHTSHLQPDGFGIGMPAPRGAGQGSTCRESDQSDLLLSAVSGDSLGLYDGRLRTGVGCSGACG